MIKVGENTNRSDYALTLAKTRELKGIRNVSFFIIINISRYFTY